MRGVFLTTTQVMGNTAGYFHMEPMGEKTNAFTYSFLHVAVDISRTF